MEITPSDFEMGNLAGEGAAGEVHKALAKRQLPFAHPGDAYALKLYRPELLKEPNQRKRIVEEYRTGSRLVHPNLVRIFHVDVEHDPPFLVMEWCDGSNLLDWRRDHTEPDEEFLIQFSTQVLDAIDFLHSARRCHRDVKPSNIHIDTKGKIRLLDYGVIRSLRDPGITETDARFVGTYRYSAPEYIFDEQLTYASELYSFGAVLYFLLHGKEIFAAAKRTVDILGAKKQHSLRFDSQIAAKGPVWTALLQLSEALLQKDPSSRPPSAMACLDILGKSIPSSIPLRVYFACSLTRSKETEKERIAALADVVRRCPEATGYSIYFPGEHTHPLGAPDLSPPEVYWIDRERVASSDLLLILADDPSFGVGQEAEIAANAGVPIALFHSKGVEVSRMLRGIAGRVIADLEFDDEADLQSKADTFFRENRSRLRLSRRSREREYHLRLGNRLHEIREARRVSPEQLAESAQVTLETVLSLETRPEQLSNISLVNLRKLTRALNIPLVEVLKDQSSKEQDLEDRYRRSLATLREFAGKHQIAYTVYAELKARGHKQLREEVEAIAARGMTTGASSHLKEEDWMKLYQQQLLNGTSVGSTETRSDE